MFVCWGASRCLFPFLTCSWACAEDWSEVIKTFVGCYPCYTISLRPANTMFPSCAPHWLFSQMAKSSRYGGGGEGALFYFGTSYNTILFYTVRLSGSHLKSGKYIMNPAVNVVDITYMLWGQHTDLSVLHQLNKTVHIWNKKAQGIESGYHPHLS